MSIPAQEQNKSEKVVSIGDVNAHTHLYSGLASLGLPALKPPPQSFLDILERLWWRLDRAINEEILYQSARYAVASALLNGTVALVDHHESPDCIHGSLDILADACEELGMAALLCYGASERNGGRAEALSGLAENERFLKTNRRNNLKGLVGIHAGFTVSDETLRDAGRLCRDYNSAIHIHAAEDQIDTMDARRRGYEGPLFRLRSLGALIPGSIVAHGIYLSADEVKMAGDEGVWLVQNPRSNENNRVGYPMELQHSPKVALGTDGFLSNMMDEQSALCRLAQAHGDNMERASRRLEAGHELIASHLGPSLKDSRKVLVKQGDKDWALDSLSISNRVVVHNGRLMTADMQSIERQAKEAASKLWTKMEALSARKMETI